MSKTELWLLCALLLVVSCSGFAEAGGDQVSTGKRLRLLGAVSRALGLERPTCGQLLVRLLDPALDFFSEALDYEPKPPR